MATLNPVIVVALIVLFALSRLLEDFMKPAMEEAGKAVGKRLGAILIDRAKARFGVTSILGVIVAYGITLALVGVGAVMVVTAPAPACEQAGAGYALVGGSLGVLA